MRALLVTEKCSVDPSERDGGAQLVETLKTALGDSLSIMQFGPKGDSSATWHYEYPYAHPNRFERRLLNAHFIAERIKSVENSFTHVLFVHASMQFGLSDHPLKPSITVWTFPMFLTPSYEASGETVPATYYALEKHTLLQSKNILTPSHLEKQQLMALYGVSKECIHVVPRGVKNALITPIVRTFDRPLRLCSIGSIKPQKNTVGLVSLFGKIRQKYPDATLQIIGPVQNSAYLKTVEEQIAALNLNQSVEITGYVTPENMPQVIREAHFHLSTSNCETFGRSIFETLASGLPNIARKSGNAAAEFLEHSPYAHFVDNDDQAVALMEEMLPNLSKFSSLACEVGWLYDDTLLSDLLLAKLFNRPPLAISDYDGTLYHKDDPEKTRRCIASFKSFPKRVICSARSLSDLLDQLAMHDLQVDWIVALGGALVTNGSGESLWQHAWTPAEVAHIEKAYTHVTRVEHKGAVMQFTALADSLPPMLGLRREVYQETAFLSQWEASKLRAVNRLLRHIQWTGQVAAFGDGIYDRELINYFDGTWITKEIVDV